MDLFVGREGFDDGLQDGDGFAELADFEELGGEELTCVEVRRVTEECLAKLGNGRLGLLELDERGGQEEASLERLGARGDRLFQVGSGGGKLVLGVEKEAHPGESFDLGGVKAKAPRESRERFGGAIGFEEFGTAGSERGGRLRVS